MSFCFTEKDNDYFITVHVVFSPYSSLCRLMRQMRKNRDAEADLMKNVEGWEVGTLFGTPVYNTLGENEWIGVTPESYYVHADPTKVEEYTGHQIWV